MQWQRSAERTESLKAIGIGRRGFVQKQASILGNKDESNFNDAKQFMTYLDSQVAPGPSVEVRPGALVWMKVAPFPFSSILSRSMTS
jgi:hypothetical protein